MARRPVQSFRDFLVDLESVAVEWDESKRRANIVKHGFDFRDVVSLLPKAVISPARTVGGEERWMGTNVLQGATITATFTFRAESCRLISVRRARAGERRRYQAVHARRTQEDGGGGGDPH
ncbi:MAG: BrnT family toxin [Acetobacteraceae bacterium]|nr:BrnT family toxin [Acetobacteraceae bacterium]